MTEQDIRWKQRLDNYSQALRQLQAALALQRERPLSELEQQGLIKAFEFTHELAWNVMKDYFEYQGAARLIGSRDATREAFANGLVTAGDDWMEMIQSRNRSSHTYNQATAHALVARITESYADLFEAFRLEMESVRDA